MDNRNTQILPKKVNIVVTVNNADKHVEKVIKDEVKTYQSEVKSKNKRIVITDSLFKWVNVLLLFVSLLLLIAHYFFETSSWFISLSDYIDSYYKLMLFLFIALNVLLLSYLIYLQISVRKLKIPRSWERLYSLNSCLNFFDMAMRINRKENYGKALEEFKKYCSLLQYGSFEYSATEELLEHNPWYVLTDESRHIHSMFGTLENRISYRLSEGLDKEHLKKVLTLIYCYEYLWLQHREFESESIPTFDLFDLLNQIETQISNLPFLKVAEEQISISTSGHFSRTWEWCNSKLENEKIFIRFLAWVVCVSIIIGIFCTLFFRLYPNENLTPAFVATMFSVLLGTSAALTATLNKK